MDDPCAVRIREARLARGLSQAELAERVRVSQPTIAHWEQGVHAPRQMAMARLAEALGVSAAWLTGEPRLAARPAGLPDRPYLERTLRHAPLYSWPKNAVAWRSMIEGRSLPLDHMPISMDGGPFVGVMAQDPDASIEFPVGSLVILDIAAPPAPGGWALTANAAGCFLRRVVDPGEPVLAVVRACMRRY
jgi:transcriptional regulator with XRE-family HTH domain